MELDQSCNFEAAYNLGIALQFGRGVNKDLEAAIQYFKKAEELGCVIAKTKIAECYTEVEGGIHEHQSSFKWYLEGAKADDAVALSVVGNFYYEKYGHDLSTWDSEQINLVLSTYKQAAAHGCSIALCGLGHIYSSDWSGRDDKKAFDYFIDSADRNMAVAQYETARCLFLGLGCEVNYDLALEYCKKDADLKDPEAIRLLGEIYFKLNKEEEALKALKQASEMNSPEASKLLGDYYKDKDEDLSKLFLDRYDVDRLNKDEYLDNRNEYIIKYRNALRREALGCEFDKVADKFRK